MLRDTTSRGLYVRVWPPHTSERRGGGGGCEQEGWQGGEGRARISRWAGVARAPSLSHTCGHTGLALCPNSGEGRRRYRPSRRPVMMPSSTGSRGSPGPPLPVRFRAIDCPGFSRLVTVDRYHRASFLQGATFGTGTYPISKRPKRYGNSHYGVKKSETHPSTLRSFAPPQLGS